MFLGLLFIITLGLPQMFCNKCNTTTEPIKKCYEDFSNYEIKVFPFYGTDEQELDRTCLDLNNTLRCIEDFIEDCDSDDQCTGDCKLEAESIKSHFLGGGLPAFYADLCSDDSHFREEYLKHIVCLKDTKDKFEICHETKEKSLDYVYELKGIEAVRATCCAFSWFHDCMVNTTEEICGVEAGKFLSDAVYMVNGQAIEKQCYSYPTCSSPPLPELSTSKEDNTPHKEEQFFNTTSDSSGASDTYVSVILFIFTSVLAIANKNIF